MSFYEHAIMPMYDLLRRAREVPRGICCPLCSCVAEGQHTTECYLVTYDCDCDRREHGMHSVRCSIWDTSDSVIRHNLVMNPHDAKVIDEAAKRDLAGTHLAEVGDIKEKVEMGVAIGDARWSYDGFGLFRREIATMEGIDLDAMAGFGDTSGPKISWDTIDTPIKPLLRHSDCNGDLSPERCAQVYPRLAELVERLTDSYDIDNGRLLVAAMKTAVESGYRLEFR